MKLTKTLITVMVMLIASLLVASFFACQQPLDEALAAAAEEEGEGDGEPDPEGSNDAVEKGINAMKAGDYEGALNWFSQAVVLNPDNGTAIIGYCMLNLADIATDDAMYTVFHDKLKMSEYPDSMNDLFNPDHFANWTVELDDGSVFPILSSVSDWDDDGTANLEDYLIQIGFNYVATYNGIEPLTPILASLLGDRLQDNLSYLDEAGDSAYIEITHDMVGIPEEDWPNDGVYPIVFKFGKAELLLVAAELEMLKMFVDMGQVWKFTFGGGTYGDDYLEEFWTVFNPTIDTIPEDFSSFNPFATAFLSFSGDEDQKVSDAKTAFSNALTHAVDGLERIRSEDDRLNFTLSSTGTGVFDGSYTFAEWKADALVVIEGMNAAHDSLTDADFDELFHFPVGSYDLFGLGWPTSDAPGVDDNIVSINLGAFFSSPVGLLSCLLDLDDTTKEPNFYRFDNSVPAPYWVDVDALSYFSYAIDGGTYDYDFSGDDTVLFIKVPDVTLNGFIETTNFPVDDPGTRVQDELHLDYVDGDSSGSWNSGETINSVEIRSDIEGVIPSTTYSSYGGDPVAYYTDFDTGINSSEISDTTFNNKGVPTANIAAFRTEAAADDSVNHMGVSGPLPILVGDSVYLGMPAWMAWNSFAAAGDTALDNYGNEIMCFGTIYFTSLNMMNDGGGEAIK